MEYPQVQRLVALFAAVDEASPAEVERVLRGARDGIAARLGEGADVRAAFRLDDDPLAEVMGGREAPAPVEAVLEVTLAPGADAEDLIHAVKGLGEELAPVADPSTIALMAGTAYLVWPDDGRLLLALAARRDPSISVAAMRRWWIEQHAELVKKVVRPQSPGYDQLHVERDLSQRASEAAGLPFVPYDMFDSIDVNTVEELTRSTLMEPATAQRLFEDEVGHVDHTSLRGALCRVLD